MQETKYVVDLGALILSWMPSTFASLTKSNSIFIKEPFFQGCLVKILAGNSFIFHSCMLFSIQIKYAILFKIVLCNRHVIGINMTDLNTNVQFREKQMWYVLLCCDYSANTCEFMRYSCLYSSGLLFLCRDSRMKCWLQWTWIINHNTKQMLTRMSYQ